MSKNKKILYLFGEGRISRLNNLSESSDEFFYGYDYIKNIYQETSIIEMSSGKRRPILSFIDKVLRKVTKLAFFVSHRTALPDANIPAGPVKPYPRRRRYFAASQD